MKRDKIKICVVTGSRSEFGLLKPLLQVLNEDPEIELILIATGFHLERSGGCLKEIEKDFKVKYKVKMYDEKDKRLMHAKGLGRGIMKLSEVFEKEKIDFLVVVGDRLEAFAATLAASLQNIPVIQIQAGDKTDSGHIDEMTRFSISRFAHILCTANESHKNRLIKMGEEPWRIFVTGSLNVESVLKTPVMKKEVLYRKLGLDPSKRTVLFLYNPITTENNPKNCVKTILEILTKENLQIIAISPNRDPGSEYVIDVLREFAKKEKITWFDNIDHEIFINLMRHADFMIGNSSCGLIEAPSLGLKVINVGMRNVGRDHAENVVFVPCKKEKIEKAIKNVLSSKERRIYTNPYGDGETSKKILSIIKNMYKKFSKEKLLNKKITY